MSSVLISFQNKKFKNNEPVVQLFSDENLTIDTILDIDICDEFLNASSDSNSSAEQLTTHTNNFDESPKQATCQYKKSKRLNDLFSDDETADTVSMSDDDCMELSHTHDDDSTVDTDECYGIYEEGDLEEILYEIPVPKTDNPRNKSLTPISIYVIDTIGLVTSRKLLKVLFDPGSTKTMIKYSTVPCKAVPS